MRRVDSTLGVSFSKDLFCPIEEVCLWTVVFSALGSGVFRPIATAFYTASSPLLGRNTGILSSSNINQQLSGFEGIDPFTLEGTFTHSPSAFEDIFPEGINDLSISASAICETFGLSGSNVCNDTDYPLDVLDVDLTLTYRYELAPPTVSTPEPSILLGCAFVVGLAVRLNDQKAQKYDSWKESEFRQQLSRD